MTLPDPRVSVVMPVYNVAAHVAQAIESVLAQTFDAFELIVVDDGGTDDSMDIVRGFADPRIRIVAQANRGLAGARNTGIAAARAPLVAFLDSDDRWRPEKLALHVIHLDTRRAIGVSFCPSRIIDAAGHETRMTMSPQLTNITPELIFCRNPVGNGSVPVIRREALDRVRFAHPDEPARDCWFDESFRQSEDIEMWLRLALVGQVQFEGIAVPLTEYRIGTGGLSAQIGRQYDSWKRVVAKLEAYAPDFAAAHVERARAFQLRYLARRAVQLGDFPMALELLREAMAASPAALASEPIKSAVTLGAAVAGTVIGGDRFARVARFATGGKLVA